MTLPTNLLRHEMMLTSEPITDITLTEIVDAVFLPLVTAKTGSQSE